MTVERGDGWEIRLGDCLDPERGLPSLESCDHIITDPPFSAWVHAKQPQADLPDGFPRKGSLGFDSLSAATMVDVAAAAARIARRWSLIFSDAESIGAWRDAITIAGIEHVRVGAWVKSKCTPQFTGDRPAAGFEAIEIAHPKGRKRWNRGGHPGVWIEQVANPSS